MYSAVSLSSRRCLRKVKMFCARVASSTNASGQTFCSSSSLPSVRPWFSTSTSRVWLAFGVSGIFRVPSSNRSFDGSNRNGPNSYNTCADCDIRGFIAISKRFDWALKTACGYSGYQSTVAHVVHSPTPRPKWSKFYQRWSERKMQSVSPRGQEARENYVQKDRSFFVWCCLLSGVLWHIPICHRLYGKFCGSEVDRLRTAPTVHLCSGSQRSLARTVRGPAQPNGAPMV